MEILSQVAKGMQGVLTEASDIIGRKTGFIKRLRKLSGSGFVQTLVFGWLSNPDSTVEELCQTALDTAGWLLGISRSQSIQGSQDDTETCYESYMCLRLWMCRPTV